MFVCEWWRFFFFTHMCPTKRLTFKLCSCVMFFFFFNIFNFRDIGQAWANKGRRFIFAFDKYLNIRYFKYSSYTYMLRACSRK